jgi:hypothetical protein
MNSKSHGHGLIIPSDFKKSVLIFWLLSVMGFLFVLVLLQIQTYRKLRLVFRVFHNSIDKMSIRIGHVYKPNSLCCDR